jgi:putative polyhydroxyalkanoate system protein
MPGFSVEVPHTLGQAVAVERLNGLLDRIAEKYQDQIKDVENQWTGNQLTFGFKTYGFHIRGTLDVLPEQVKIEGQLPLAAMMFKGRIESSIRDEIVKLLS